MNRKIILKEARDCSIMSVADIELQYKKRKITVGSVKINNSEAIYKFFLANYYNPATMLVKEFFYMLFLNRSNKIIAVCKISEGGINGTAIDVRIICSAALINLASAGVAIHNHPSGNIFPSKSDEVITDKISKALTLIDVVLIDHLIVTEDGYYSFSDEGRL